MFKTRFATALAGVLAAVSLQAVAYTVYINDTVYTTSSRPEVRVTHNDNGLYIVIPGIDLGNGQTQTSSSTSTSTNNTSTSTTNTSTGTTNTSTGTTNTSTGTTSTSTSTTNTSTSTTNSSSGSCKDSGTVSCWASDYGPAGNENNSKIEIPNGAILAIPFSVGTRSSMAYGGMQFAWIEGQEVQNDAEFYAWFSAEPGGKPLQGRACAGVRGVNDTVNWIQGMNYDGYCRLPDTKTTVYLNTAFCLAAEGDLICANPKAWGGAIRLYTSSRASGY